MPILLSIFNRYAQTYKPRKRRDSSTPFKLLDMKNFANHRSSKALLKASTNVQLTEPSGTKWSAKSRILVLNWCLPIFALGYIHFCIEDRLHACQDLHSLRRVHWISAALS